MANALVIETWYSEDENEWYGHAELLKRGKDGKVDVWNPLASCRPEGTFLTRDELLGFLKGHAKTEKWSFDRTLELGDKE